MSLQPSLLSYLRRRFHAVHWLFALLIMLKLAMGTLCFLDGAPGVAPTATAQTVSAVSAADSEPPCWHAGAGGCHCNCTHATPMTEVGLAGIQRVSAAGVSMASPLQLEPALARNPLRPPIA
jgi:hypothetical protein